ncbi:MAG: hypothetical protein IJ295_00115 [Clostridia bacterium]|nr:hypothetical protein [Clostridia bacterium]
MQKKWRIILPKPLRKSILIKKLNCVVGQFTCKTLQVFLRKIWPRL